MRAQIPDIQDDERIVWGYVNGAGGAASPPILSGSGDFRVTRTAAGVYVINFLPPFAQIPAAQALSPSARALAYASVPAPSNVAFIFGTTLGGAGGDCDFSFMAIGKTLL